MGICKIGNRGNEENHQICYEPKDTNICAALSKILNQKQTLYSQARLHFENLNEMGIIT